LVPIEEVLGLLDVLLYLSLLILEVIDLLGLGKAGEGKKEEEKESPSPNPSPVREGGRPTLLGRPTPLPLPEREGSSYL
jgi:hypothetical protein